MLNHPASPSQVVKGPFLSGHSEILNKGQSQQPQVGQLSSQKLPQNITSAPSLSQGQSQTCKQPPRQLGLEGMIQGFRMIPDDNARDQALKALLMNTWHHSDDQQMLIRNITNTNLQKSCEKFQQILGKLCEISDWDQKKFFIDTLVRFGNYDSEFTQTLLSVSNRFMPEKECVGKTGDSVDNQTPSIQALNPSVSQNLQAQESVQQRADEEVRKQNLLRGVIKCENFYLYCSQCSPYDQEDLKNEQSDVYLAYKIWKNIINEVAPNFKRKDFIKNAVGAVIKGIPNPALARIVYDEACARLGL